MKKRPTTIPEASKTFILLATALLTFFPAFATAKIDSLLNVLDKTIDDRDRYIDARDATIATLKRGLDTVTTKEDIFRLNSSIVDNYESFNSDSAQKYLKANLAIAEDLGNEVFLHETEIRLGLIYAMNGQFTQADKLFRKIPFESLPAHNRARFAWAQLKFLENQSLYTDDEESKKSYLAERLAWRDTLVNMLGEGTKLRLKEEASRYRDRGEYAKALPLFTSLLKDVEPGSHEAAMMSKALADIYFNLGDSVQYKWHLIESSISDVKMAVMENESLLALSELLYHEGDIDRAYKFMHVALEDANRYNSNFKNAVIARVHPIVEHSYIARINAQQRHIRLIMWVIALLAVAMAITALVLHRQRKVVSQSRAELLETHKSLEKVSAKQAEANIIREKYVGYFMHQCALSVDKLDKFRINVNRKLKANLYEEAFVMSARPLEKELEELYDNFDKAFLNMYPNFVEEFNMLLRPDKRFQLSDGKLNATLRIFALIRLGINDMTQIAEFLHYSVQTVYNYKSKVRKSSDLTAEEFEEKVKKIGKLLQ